MGGAARREDLLAAGVTPKRLRVAYAKGRVVREWRGCYALPDAHRAVVDARILSGRISCVSALDLFGLPLMSRSTRTHVLVPRDRGFASRDTRATRGALLHRADYRESPGSEVVTSVTTALDIAGHCVDPLGHLVLIDAAVHRGLIGCADVATFRESSRSRREFLTVHLDGRAESLLETITRYRLTSAGLAVESQVRIAGVGRVDLLVEGWLVVELDGRDYHFDERAFAEDRRRDRKLAALGYTVLRFTYDDVVRHSERVLEDVLAVLTGAKSPRIPAV
jgi:very-short-patch-repair endonuclease